MQRTSSSSHDFRQRRGSETEVLVCYNRSSARLVFRLDLKLSSVRDLSGPCSGMVLVSACSVFACLCLTVSAQWTCCMPMVNRQPSRGDVRAFLHASSGPATMRACTHRASVTVGWCMIETWRHDERSCTFPVDGVDGAFKACVD